MQASDAAHQLAVAKAAKTEAKRAARAAATGAALKQAANKQRKFALELLYVSRRLKPTAARWP